MGKYLAQRLATIVPTLVLVSMLVFGLQQLLPGDPAIVLAGEDRDPAAVEHLRQKLNLDKPLALRYLYWAGGATDYASACRSSHADEFFWDGGVVMRLPIGQWFTLWNSFNQYTFQPSGPPGLDANQRFVYHLYQALLGRTGSPDEVNFFGSTLDQGFLTQEQLATFFLSSS